MGGERACLLDFDHTLFDTDRFFWVDVRAAFGRIAIDSEVWDESYARVWPTGYSLEKHLEDLAREGPVTSADLAALRRVFRERFSDLRPYCFGDVEPFLRRLQGEKVRCFLLSFGDPDWQAYKVHGARIAHFFEEVFTTGREQAKVEVVAGLVGRIGRLAVVDNDPRELDLVKARYAHVETFWITRVPPEALTNSDPEIRDRFREARRYATFPAEFEHHRCQTLNEVLV